MAAWTGGEHGYTYTDGWVPLLSPWNYHNIVNWLHPKYKSLEKKESASKPQKSAESIWTRYTRYTEVALRAWGHDWNTRGAWNQEIQSLLCDEVSRVTVLQTIKKPELLTQKLLRGNPLWNLLGKVPGALNDLLYHHTLGAQRRALTEKQSWPVPTLPRPACHSGRVPVSEPPPSYLWGWGCRTPTSGLFWALLLTSGTARCGHWETGPWPTFPPGSTFCPKMNSKKLYSFQESCQHMWAGVRKTSGVWGA